MNYMPGTQASLPAAQTAVNPLAEKAAVNARLHNRSGITIALASVASAFTVASIVRFAMSFEQSDLAELVDELIGISHLGLPDWIYPLMCAIGMIGSCLLTSGLWWLFGAAYTRRDILTGSEAGPYNLIKSGLIVKLCGFILKFSVAPLLLIVGIIKAYILSGEVSGIYFEDTLYSLIPVAVFAAVITVGSVFYKRLLGFVNQLRDTHNGAPLAQPVDGHAKRIIAATLIFALCAFVYPCLVLPNLGELGGSDTVVGDVALETLSGTLNSLVCSGLRTAEVNEAIAYHDSYYYNDYYYDDYDYDYVYKVDPDDYLEAGGLGAALCLIYNGDLNIDRYVSENIGSFFFSSKSGEAGRLSVQAMIYYMLQFATAVMAAVYMLKLEEKQALLRQGGAMLPGREALYRPQRGVYSVPVYPPYAQPPMPGAGVYGGYPQQPQPYQQQVYPAQPTQAQAQAQYQQYMQYMAQVQQQAAQAQYQQQIAQAQYQQQLQSQQNGYYQDPSNPYGG